jgi:hypothetical protein
MNLLYNICHPFSSILCKRTLVLAYIVIFSTLEIWANPNKEVPFSVNNTHLTVWNGEKYVPITIKGINLGVALPGKFPSELTPTYELYYEWFEMIRAAGFNTIRLYTLHYPRFYQAFKDYNTANPQSPLLLLHGVWLEEELEGYTQDLYDLNDVFTKEIQDNINCVHGNNIIDHRYGKAYGTYTVDISPWVLGYIIGREIHPVEIKTTNGAHPTHTSFDGKHLSISDVSASEVFISSMMDKLIEYEQTNYGTIRPVSFSSWPTLDPLTHPTETHTEEDVESVDISGMDFSKTKAGIFASYHAYPYYPDFISREETYTSFYDSWGQNSYIGYLTDLKSHYCNMPLIIAEFGVPSSWGVAHYSHSGMNHGGLDETVQGLYNMRMLENISDANCGGGVMFAWIDEWFKRTWITDPMDFLMDRRIIWHNIVAAEQNFGLIGFTKSGGGYVNQEISCTDCGISKIETNADFKFFRIRISTESEFGNEDTLWVGIDTYDAVLGESILPNKKTVTNRAEFALMITADKAELFVTQAYDLFGIWHNTSKNEQLYQSVASDGAPWHLVRLKNNQEDNNIQYIGSLQVNRLNLPESSLDAVRINKEYIEIYLPWTLINFVDPSTYQVIHDNKATPETELKVSDGIALSFFYNGNEIVSNQRFLWETWNHAENTEAYIKASYTIIKEQLLHHAGALIARKDSFTLKDAANLNVKDKANLLSNDNNYDGGETYVSVIDNPKNGILLANSNGNFTYTPDNGFAGTDTFTYRLFSGINKSELAKVILKVDGGIANTNFIKVYPNPSIGVFTFESSATMERIEIFTPVGQKIMDMNIYSSSYKIDLTQLQKGHYFVKFHSGTDVIVKRLLLIK